MRKWGGRSQTRDAFKNAQYPSSLSLEEFHSREKVLLFLVLQHKVCDKTDPECLQQPHILHPGPGEHIILTACHRESGRVGRGAYTHKLW